MTTPLEPTRLAYDDLATPHEMYSDCQATRQRMPGLERAARAAVAPAPSIHFEDYPREVAKRDILISGAAAQLANALHLHLD